MRILDLTQAEEFSPTHHIQKTLAASPRCGISIACWEPEQVSPIHAHRGADEIYHQVMSLTRMVLCRIQAGADRTPVFFEVWPPA